MTTRLGLHSLIGLCGWIRMSHLLKLSTATQVPNSKQNIKLDGREWARPPAHGTVDFRVSAEKEAGRWKPVSASKEGTYITLLFPESSLREFCTLSPTVHHVLF